MPITTRWYDDDHYVIYQVFEGSWTWEELSMGWVQIRSMASSVNHPIIMFGDLTNTHFMPTGNALGQGRSVMQKLPSNMQLVVIAIHSRVLEVFTNITLDLVPGLRNRIRFAKTVEEGRTIVESALMSTSRGQ